MIKTLSNPRPILIGKNTSYSHSEYVGQNGNGNGGKNTKNLLPSDTFKEVRINNAQGKQRKQKPESATGICHLKLCEAQIYNIAANMNGITAHSYEFPTEL